jgi:hypothetical protein
MLGAAPTSDGLADMSRHAVVADLRAAVTAVDKQMTELRIQRARVVRLMAGVQRNGQLSPMPAAVSAFYELMRARAADDKTRRLVTAERDFMELAFYRGDMPPESAIVYEGLTEARLADSSALFGRIADRTDRVRSLDDREIESIVAAAVHRISDQLGPRSPPAPTCSCSTNPPPASTR